MRYLITFRDRVIPQGTLLDTFWDDDSDDPRQALYTAIYRLRRELCALHPSLERLVSVHNGLYALNGDLNIWIDAEVFERLCAKARMLRDSDSEAAVSAYREAMQLYRDDYLSDMTEEPWAEPVRQHYRGLYRACVTECIELLNQLQRSGDARTVAQEALMLLPENEDLHVLFLETLLILGRRQEAREHYAVVASTLYGEKGASPSAGMVRLHGRLLATDEAASEGGHPFLDLEVIQSRLESQDFGKTGPFICNEETFQFIHEMECRRTSDTGRPVMLARVRLAAPGGEDVGGARRAERALDDLESIVCKELRQGDVFCRWCDGAFLLLLPGTDRHGIACLEARIKQGFRLPTGYRLEVRARPCELPARWGLGGTEGARHDAGEPRATE